MQDPLGQRLAQMGERVGVTEVNEAAGVTRRAEQACLGPLDRHDTAGQRLGIAGILRIAFDRLLFGRDVQVDAKPRQRLGECALTLAARIEHAVLPARIVEAAS
jgi:hypothetical protein